MCFFSVSSNLFPKMAILCLIYYTIYFAWLSLLSNKVYKKPKTTLRLEYKSFSKGDALFDKTFIKIFDYTSIIRLYNSFLQQKKNVAPARVSNPDGVCPSSLT